MLLDYEHFNRETNGNLSNWWLYWEGSSSISADGTGPFGYGRYLQSGGNNGGPSRALASNPQTLWFQGHLMFTSYSTYGGSYLQFDQGGSSQLRFGVNSNGQLIVGRGDLTPVATSSRIFSLSTWHFVQIRASIANTGGTVEIWVDGQKWLTYTGNTQNTGSAWVDRWWLGTSISGFYRWANIIVYDETGAAPNARTPETRIFADPPAGAGASTGWTPSAGSNYQAVDEQPNDGDTTYVSAASALLDDLYSFGAPVPAGAVVYMVGAEIDACKDDAGTNNVDVLIRGNTTVAAGGSPFALTTAYQRFRGWKETDPSTGAAWTVANANGSQVGQRRTA